MPEDRPATSLTDIRFESNDLDPCEMDCVVCDEGTGHALWGPPNQQGGHEGEEHGCETNTEKHTCETHECEPAFAAQVELSTDLLASASPDEVARFLVANPESVSLNESRSAIQFHGCQGTIYAHVPMPAAMIQDVAGIAGVAARVENQPDIE